ncbi:MAG: X-Pro dipeptidyl-peptidase, partial [Solirubrobacteraceae bacterium]|nr:X-Pro dipeptidyl-peptidase [Solirubrobacteraceae bacterium]
THDVELALGRDAGAGVLAPGAGGPPSSLTDTGTASEERALKEGLASEDGWLFYASAPLAKDMRIAGSPVLDADIVDSTDHGQLSPTLVDVAPDGTATVISRGHMNLQYRGGLDKAVPVAAGVATRARVRLAPQDQTVVAGHRIGLIFATSNTVWALPDTPGGATIAVQHGLSKLVLPVAPLDG